MMYCPSSVGREGNLREADLGQQEQRQNRPRHLQEEQEQRDADERAEEQPHPYRHLPPAEQGDEEIGRQPVDRAAHEFGRGAQPQEVSAPRTR